MGEQRKNSKLATWLDSIQQDSWQLELVISGVVLFLLLGANQPLEDLSRGFARDTLTGKGALTTMAGGFVVLRLSYFALLLAFIFHLLLRGLWIGAIGLRSVSGDFDYNVLNYQPKFTSWLQNRMGSFDDYIAKLEMQCSVAFSFAFLIFFGIISVGLYGLFIGVSTYTVAVITGIGNQQEPSGFGFLLTVGFNLLLVLIGLIYLIDFSTLGWFKRKKWTHRWYFPIYRLLGILTLARIYRPFYYNLIDHPFGRKLVKRLWLIIFLGMTLASISTVRYDYFPNEISGEYGLASGVYLDQTTTKDVHLRSPSLASRYAEKDYLQVFSPYIPGSDDAGIKKLFPKLSKAHKTAYAIDGPVNLWRSDNFEVNNDSLLIAHQAIHKLFLNDSLLTDVPWRFYHHPMRDQPGLVYDLPVFYLPRGEHELRFEKFNSEGNSPPTWETKAKITFLR